MLPYLYKYHNTIVPLSARFLLVLTHLILYLCPCVHFVPFCPSFHHVSFWFFSLLFKLDLFLFHLVLFYYSTIVSLSSAAL